MIKPRSSSSHFELQAEAQQRNFEGETNSCSFESFNQLNGQSILPVAPMVSVTKPATIDRGSKVGEITNPISSTETPQPTVRELLCMGCHPHTIVNPAQHTLRKKTRTDVVANYL